MILSFYLVDNIITRDNIWRVCCPLRGFDLLISSLVYIADHRMGSQHWINY